MPRLPPRFRPHRQAETMRFDVLTLFPDLFQGYLTQSLLKLALEKGLVEIHLWNIRDWATSKHKSVDDRPFGGGPGMVIMPEPVYAGVEAVHECPQGEKIQPARILTKIETVHGYSQKLIPEGTAMSGTGRLRPRRLEMWTQLYAAGCPRQGSLRRPDA